MSLSKPINNITMFIKKKLCRYYGKNAVPTSLHSSTFYCNEKSQY